jgi:hypothetical protein
MENPESKQLETRCALGNPLFASHIVERPCKRPPPWDFLQISTIHRDSKVVGAQHFNYHPVTGATCQSDASENHEISALGEEVRTTPVAVRLMCRKAYRVQT